MTKKDLIKVYAYTKTIFNNFSMPTNELQAETQGLVWYKFLKPYSMDVIYSAIDLYAENNHFVNISQIAKVCDKVQRMKEGTYRDYNYYYNEILDAVSYSKCRENFEKLSQFSKEIVRGPHILAQWANAGEYFHTSIAGKILEQIKTKLSFQNMNNIIQSNMSLIENQSRTATQLIENTEEEL